MTLTAERAGLAWGSRVLVVLPLRGGGRPGSLAVHLNIQGGGGRAEVND